MSNLSKNVWELIMDYDPNGIMAVDEDFTIKLVNPSFAKMFYLQGKDIIGRSVFEFFNDFEDYRLIMEEDEKILKKIHTYENYGLTVSEVTFRIKSEKLIVKIFHDITDQVEKEKELKYLKIHIIEEVQKIVDKQMKTGQEIASILGETTAETKATLVKLLDILKKEK
ncbi:PAS domain S-box protein [Geotoga petraea]|uniref:PAS domain S-box-containing protein n=1 Tax=Geotoga petraea TaxID=28234 RepID=A0A1G6II64_9BACT|nr:PAS domain S-box protein [Geotoga petraea]SDC06131.1 PAS domain S-box-containing protein [Geotoga petraea]